MEIQEVVAKAIEGGYTNYQQHDRSWPTQAHYFLETSFWEALGHTLGWEGHFEYVQLRGHAPSKIRQPLWLYYWHRFNNHLATGKTPESFFASFPCAAHTSSIR